jgi:uncharacterized protein (DUF2342 family)
VTRATARGHLAVINQADRVTPLAPVTAGFAQHIIDVVDAAQRWADEADELASTMGWTPSESSDLGLATRRLLDAVYTLRACGDPGPPG